LPMGTLSPLAPFRLAPRFVGRVWGFRDLRPWYDHVVAEGQDAVGEVWLTGDENLVATGPFAGRKLGEVFAEVGRELLGESAPETASPLLAKVLFAADKLSVQVHPDDRMAQKYGDPRGKTECWYVLDAKPGAQLAVGLKQGVTLDQVRAEIADGTLEQSLKAESVQTGEMVFVDAGTVHAIWPGSIILETQQNCDLTYRMFDYGRPRELQVEKSLEATRFATRAGKVPPVELGDRTVLIDVEYFRVEQVKVKGTITREALCGDQPTGLAYVFAAAGAARIEGKGFEAFELPTRAVAVLPATASDFTVRDLGGLELIRLAPRWPKA